MKDAHTNTILGLEKSINRVDREKRNGHKAALLWLTGLPCSGKSIIAREAEKLLFDQNVQVKVLDGDELRKGLNRDLGFSPKERSENIRRVSEVAKLFVESGMIVIAAFISPYRKDRDAIRVLFSRGDFIEIHVKATLETCKKRDTKGMYKKALAGKISEFTGVSAPYEEPLNPEVILDTEQLSVGESTQRVMDYLIKNGILNFTAEAMNDQET